MRVFKNSPPPRHIFVLGVGTVRGTSFSHEVKFSFFLNLKK
nr:MAG TPA: hypothetical protein [Caudoviricetes sp.]